MNSVEALVELIVEAKSLNRNDSRLSFLRNEIEQDLEILEEYRKIEKELDIDLLTLFKVLRTGVYIKQYDEIEHYYLKLFGDGINFCLTTYVGVKVILNQDDYGKTWSFDKEDLL